MWSVTDLSVAYGGHRAVSGVSFELAPGTITVLVGGDGAGKTSILRALAGVTAPSAGRISAPPREQIGYVSAGPGLYADLTVLENLQFAGRSYKVEPGRLGGRIEHLLEATGLTQARGRPAGKLSGGMRQKLALAVAVIHRPRLLILDEPTTGVDPVSRAELWRLIARTAAGGAAVVAATSYIDEAERAGEVVVMVDGSAVASGSPQQIVDAVPGTVIEFAAPPEVWRRGASWRVWCADRPELDKNEVRHIDLEDAVVIGELMRRRQLLAQRGGAR
ncbi:MAG: ABC transporter ATP-binding protein [Actinomycetota bacterium]